MTVSRVLLVLLFLQILKLDSIAQQNLIPNGSFEIFKGKGKNVNSASPWKGINTADHFKMTHPKDTGICRGARTGKAYIGLRFQPKYQEFVEVTFPEKLKKDSLYHVEMYIRLAYFSNVLLQSIGFHFSTSGFKNYKDINEFNTFSFNNINGLGKDRCWVKIELDFRAVGDEKMMMIGNFNRDVKKDFIKIKKLRFDFWRECYYFIDDVSLTKKNS